MTQTQPPPHPERRPGLRKTAARAGAVAWAALRLIRLTRRIAWQFLQVILALIIIFEEWGWRPLAALLARLSRLRPVAALEAGIARLPPYPALAVFALPSILLFPLKLVALWLIADGHVLAAGLLFAGAKVAGTAFLARIFQLTQPALMQLGWFARAYHTLMPWKQALVARVKGTPVWLAFKAMKARLGAAVVPLVTRLKQQVLRLLRRG